MGLFKAREVFGKLCYCFSSWQGAFFRKTRGGRGGIRKQNSCCLHVHHSLPHRPMWLSPAGTPLLTSPRNSQNTTDQTTVIWPPPLRLASPSKPDQENKTHSRNVPTRKHGESPEPPLSSSVILTKCLGSWSPDPTPTTEILIFHYPPPPPPTLHPPDTQHSQWLHHRAQPVVYPPLTVPGDLISTDQRFAPPSSGTKACCLLWCDGWEKVLVHSASEPAILRVSIFSIHWNEEWYQQC